MLPSFFAEEVEFIDSEITKIKTLDSIFDTICNKDDNIYLKIDTQGFEEKVIRGAESSLAYIDTIQLELSLIPLYKNELIIHEMCSLLKKRGYTLVSVEPGLLDHNTGQLLQIDGIFHRH